MDQTVANNFKSKILVFVAIKLLEWQKYGIRSDSFVSLGRNSRVEIHLKETETLLSRVSKVRSYRNLLKIFKERNPVPKLYCAYDCKFLNCALVSDSDEQKIWRPGGRSISGHERRGRLAINRDALFMRRSSSAAVLLRERKREKVAQLPIRGRLLSANRDALNETRILIDAY